MSNVISISRDRGLTVGDIDQISRSLGELHATMIAVQKMLEQNQAEFNGRISIVEHRINELEQAEYKRKGAMGLMVALAGFAGFILSLFSSAVNKFIHLFTSP